ncbi:transposable element Tcb1 transposase [Trichonephila clavipes]|nr:transposable element Tcb1 transposase [Trichonephila clavipes]
MTAQRYVHDILQPHVLPLMQGPPRSHFSTRQCSASHGNGITRLSSYCYYPSLACSIPRFVSNQAYLGSFGTVSWAYHEFERTRGKVTANMERNVSRHPTERGVQQVLTLVWKLRKSGASSGVILVTWSSFKVKRYVASRYKMPVLGQVERGASIDLTWGRFWDKWSVERG